MRTRACERKPRTALASMAMHAQDAAAGTGRPRGPLAAPPAPDRCAHRGSTRPSGGRPSTVITDAKAPGRRRARGPRRRPAPACGLAALATPDSSCSLAQNSEHKPVALAAADKLEDEAALRAVSERAKSRPRRAGQSSASNPPGSRPPDGHDLRCHRSAGHAQPASPLTTRRNARRMSRSSKRCARSRRQERAPWPSARPSAKSWRGRRRARAGRRWTRHAGPGRACRRSRGPRPRRSSARFEAALDACRRRHDRGRPAGGTRAARGAPAGRGSGRPRAPTFRPRGRA